MKIIIDCSNVRMGGGIQVAVSFFRDLNNPQYVNDEFILLVSYELNKKINPSEYGSHIRVIALESKHSNNIILRALRCKYFEKQINPDCIFVLFGPSYHKSRTPKIVGFARPHYVYRSSPYFSIAPRGERFFMFILMKLHEYLFIRNSDSIIFETEDAKRIMQDKIFNQHPISLHVVGNTLNNVFMEEERWVTCEKLEVNAEKFRFLCVSANYSHKNIEVLKETARYLNEKHRQFKYSFVLTLTEDEFPLESDIQANFELIGSVNHNELPDLYKKCNAFILPTLLEVFSTSYLEAMFMNKPILTSDLSFAHDICRDAALYFNPLSPADIGKAVYRLANDTNLQEMLIASGNNQLSRFTDSQGRTEAYLRIIKEEMRQAKAQ